MKSTIKQSTSYTFRLGPFVDDTDGKTAETGLTISQSDIRISKNGGAFAQSNNSAGATHDENGFYAIPLDATDTGTLGELKVAVFKTGALPVWKEFEVVPANTYNSLVAGSDNLTVDAVEISGDSGAADNLEAASDGTGYNLGGGQVVSASVTGAVGSVTGNVGGNVTGSIGSLATQAKADVNAEVDTAITDAALVSETYLDSRTLAAASYATASALDAVDNFIDTEVSAIKAKTDNLPASPAGVGDAMTLADSEDVYWANIDLAIDAANTQDEYTIQWIKNGNAVTSGITSPQIQVIKRVNGTDLISATNVTEIGSTGAYKYNAITSERTTAGEAVVVQVTATIDAATRTWRKVVSRDSV